MIKRTCLLALATVMLVAAACGGGGGTTTTVRTQPPGPKVTPNAVTGLGELDALIQAVVEGDNIELAALTGYQRLPCTKGAPSELAPICRETEADGALVEVLPSGSCERTLVRPEQVPDTYRTAFPGPETVVLAAYRPAPEPQAFGAGFSAGAVVVFRTGQHPNSSPMGVALHVKEGRIVWIEPDCDNVFTLIASERVGSYILDPTGTAPATTPGATATATPPTATGGAPPSGLPADTPPDAPPQ